MPRRLLALIPLLIAGAHAQTWDFPNRAAESLSKAADKKLKLSFEQRGRYERRTGNAFGAEPEFTTGLERIRLGLSYTPLKWLRLSGMVQDVRAPWYGHGAPNNLRDHADLQEGYIELFPSSKGFGMTAGRIMMNYGEGRLIGAAQWGSLARTFDHARVYWRWPKAQLEVLLFSTVKIRITEFNRPVLGDRVWGTYNVFPDIYKKIRLDLYLLRHDQNRPGGFTGIGKLAVNTVGFRLTGPLPAGLKYSLEAALQNGEVGPASHRAAAAFAAVSRRFTLAGMPLDLSAEYKYASGTANPADPSRSGTFDQMYPANHDKFGHADLIGWRNLQNARSVTGLGLTKNFTLNFMYDSYWLANVRDSLYNLQGRAIARSATGTAGRHIGQEADIYGVYRYKHFLFGAGYGHFFQGEFARNATRGVTPTYLYIFHTYSL